MTLILRRSFILQLVLILDIDEFAQIALLIDIFVLVLV